jgi:hypothetical protein
MAGFRDRLTDHQLKELLQLEFQAEAEESIMEHLGREHQRLIHYIVSNRHATRNAVNTVPEVKSLYNRYMDSKDKLSDLQDAIRTITMNAKHSSPGKSFSRSYSFSRSRSRSRSRTTGGTRRHKRIRS